MRYNITSILDNSTDVISDREECSTFRERLAKI